MSEIIVVMIAERADDFANIHFVFLDRDGVLNRNPAGGRFVTSWEEFEFLPGVEEAIAGLNRSGRKVILVTNQRGIALGLYSEPDLQALHDKLQHHLAAHGALLDAIYYCPHEDGQCNCRKPLPGLFEQAFRDFPGANAGNSVMVGDSLSDMEAGFRLGMRSVCITEASELPRPGTDRAVALATVTVTSLLDFVQRFLS